jgi:hypothetical protein
VLVGVVVALRKFGNRTDREGTNSLGLFGYAYEADVRAPYPALIARRGANSVIALAMGLAEQLDVCSRCQLLDRVSYVDGGTGRH